MILSYWAGYPVIGLLGDIFFWDEILLVDKRSRFSISLIQLLGPTRADKIPRFLWWTIARKWLNNIHRELNLTWFQWGVSLHPNWDIMSFIYLVTSERTRRINYMESMWCLLGGFSPSLAVMQYSSIYLTSCFPYTCSYSISCHCTITSQLS